jgi:hypothetical protein
LPRVLHLTQKDIRPKLFSYCLDIRCVSLILSLFPTLFSPPFCLGVCASLQEANKAGGSVSIAPPSLTPTPATLTRAPATLTTIIRLSLFHAQRPRQCSPLQTPHISHFHGQRPSSHSSQNTTARSGEPADATAAANISPAMQKRWPSLRISPSVACARAPNCSRTAQYQCIGIVRSPSSMVRGTTGSS